MLLTRDRLHLALPAFILGLWLLPSLATSGLSQAEAPDPVGSFVLDFTATNLDGSRFDARSLEGKVVLVDFWAVWCAPCIAAFPKLNNLQADFATQGLQVLGIAVYSGSHEDVSQFMSDHDVDYTIVVGDEDLVEKFGVIGFPTYYLLSADGRIEKQFVGELTGLYKEVREDIRRLTEQSSSEPG